MCLEQIFEHKLNFKIHINNLGSKDSLKLYNDELLKFFSSSKEKLSEHSQSRLVSGNALRILDSKDLKDTEFLESHIIPKIEEFLPENHLKAYDELLELIQGIHPSLKIVRDEKLVRGLDYYNGTCFEIKLDDQKQPGDLLTMEKEIFGASQNTLLAGGRYDYLATQFGYNRGASLSSVGWAAGINRLVLILEHMNSLKRINTSSR